MLGQLTLLYNTVMCISMVYYSTFEIAQSIHFINNICNDEQPEYWCTRPGLKILFTVYFSFMFGLLGCIEGLIMSIIMPFYIPYIYA